LKHLAPWYALLNFGVWLERILRLSGTLRICYGQRRKDRQYSNDYFEWSLVIMDLHGELSAAPIC
jgi:hypothetical protein